MDGLGREAAVREGDHHRRAGPEHPGGLAQHLDRADQVVDRHAAEHRVERAVRERQPRIAVEVVHDSLGRHRVGRQLGGVHAEHRRARSERSRRWDTQDDIRSRTRRGSPAEPSTPSSAYSSPTAAIAPSSMWVTSPGRSVEAVVGGRVEPGEETVGERRGEPSRPRSHESPPVQCGAICQHGGRGTLGTGCSARTSTWSCTCGPTRKALFWPALGLIAAGGLIGVGTALIPPSFRPVGQIAVALLGLALAMWWAVIPYLRWSHQHLHPDQPPA